MKTSIITCAVFASSILCAQTNTQQPVKVRIKKVENINGVEKVTDTTFTTTDPSTVNMGENIVVTEGSGDANVVIVKTRSSDGDASSEARVIKRDANIDAEVEKALKEAGMDANTKGKKVVIVHSDTRSGEGKNEPKTISKIVIVKTGVNDASAWECKKAGIPVSKEKLMIEDMTCTPNPSNGKFDLKFSGTKSPVDITVKDINGKIVYTESVKHFNGSYEKEISLDKETKGIYFVTITQGARSTTKKLVVE
jgi:hypothetical protein